MTDQEDVIDQMDVDQDENLEGTASPMDQESYDVEQTDGSEPAENLEQTQSADQMESSDQSESPNQEAVDQELVDHESSDQELEQTSANTGQTEMPFAIVDGKGMTQLPLDLYIPPDALAVILETFEGPLDLLLYLIKKQNLDILNINVYEITKQYMDYVELMDNMHLELAGEYLVMAAMLAEIKSRMLLPRSEEAGEEDEEDPRAELIRRLQEYEQFKKAAENLDELPRFGRDFIANDGEQVASTREMMHPDVDMTEMLLALRDIMARADMNVDHQISHEKLSTRERMTQVLEQLKGQAFMPFISLFEPDEGRGGVVVTFLAIMELAKESLVDIVQSDTFGAIHIKARSE